MGPNNSTHAQVLDVVLYRIIPDRNELRQAGHDKRTRREKKSHKNTHNADNVWGFPLKRLGSDKQDTI